MEVTPFTIYLIGLIDSLLHLLDALTGISAASTIIFAISYFSCDRSCDQKVWYRRLKYALVTTAIIIFSFVTIPTPKTLIAMYILPPIASSEVVKEIPDVLLDFVKSYVNEELEENNLKVQTK